MAATVTVLGNIGSDAERRETPSGIPYLSFTVADSHWKRNASGEMEKTGTTWRRVSTFRGVDYMAPRLVKGTRVLVTGSEELRTWEKDGGAQGFSLDVVAHSIDVVALPAGANAAPNTVAPVQNAAYAHPGGPGRQQGYAQPPAGYAPQQTQAAPARYPASGLGGYDPAEAPF